MSSITAKSKRVSKDAEYINNTSNKKAKVRAGDDATKEKQVTAKTQKSPFDLYFEEKRDWLNENMDIVGEVMIKGIQDDDDSDEEEKEVDKSKYTEKQMRSLRCVMTTKSRSDQLDQMHDLILGDQADSSVMCFNTSFSYEVLDSWEQLESRFLPRKSISKKFDILFAYTFLLLRFDTWMTDNEGGMDVVVKGLGAAWKKLLKNSDEKIGWDTKYTKPGIMELLKQFKSRIDRVDSCYQMGKFKYN